MRFFPLHHAPEEALRLLEEQEGELGGAAAAARGAALPELRQAVRAGRASGALWVGPKDEAVGLALWERVPGLGRRVDLFYVSPDYRRGTALGAFLQGIGGAPSGAAGGAPEDRIFLLPGELLGPHDEGAGTLRGLGFTPCTRPAMRRGTRDIPGLLDRGPAHGGFGALDDREGPDLEELQARAYAGGLSRLWFPDGDLRRESHRFVEMLREGAWGTWLRGASLGLRTAQELDGATVVVHAPPRCPLLLSLAVRPELQGQGRGRALLLATLEKLQHLGHEELELNVVRENAPAYHLYTSLRFVEVEGTAARFWIRDPAVTSGPPGDDAVGSGPLRASRPFPAP